MYDYLILSLGIVSNVLAQMLLKMGMKQTFTPGGSLFTKIGEVITNYSLVGSVVLYGLGFVAYAIALKNMELSRAYPIASTAMIVLLLILSVIFLKESLGFYKSLGIALCILGIVFISMQNK